jgi:hypothetical protein
LGVGVEHAREAVGFAVGFGAASGVGAPGNKLACMAANGGKYTPFPPDQAIAYIVDVFRGVKCFL